MAISLRVEIAIDTTVGEVISRVPFVLADILGITSMPSMDLKEMAEGIEVRASRLTWPCGHGYIVNHEVDRGW